MPIDTANPLLPLVAGWLKAIKAALRYKDREFQGLAMECMRFLDGGKRLNDYLWGAAGAGHGSEGHGGYSSGGDGEEMAPPGFRFTMNKVAELCQLFGPMLYNRNPVRTCTPRKFDQIDPMIFAALNPQLYQQATQPIEPPPQGVQLNPMQQAMMMQKEMGQQQAIQQLQGMIQQAQQTDQMSNCVDATRAKLIEEYLNYTPNELNLKGHSRLVVDEALIKGLGCWWTELFQAKGSPVKLIGSFYDTVDNLVLDCDVELLDDCKWVARRCIHPQWEVEDNYGLPRDSLKGALRSGDQVGANNTMMTEGNERTDIETLRRGKTNDLVVYYKIYSKMGLGGRMKGMDPDLKSLFDTFGDNCLIVVCDGIPYPLNMPPDVLNEAPPPTDPETGEPNDQETQQWLQGLQQRVDWPIPFWADGKSWPFTPLAYHPRPNCVYPYSHVSAGIGELKWINWAMSFLASKVRTSCTTIIGVAKGWDESEKKKALNPGDNRVIEIDTTMAPTGKISDLISFIQNPEFHPDIYNVLEKVIDALDKRWGTSELLYGQSGQAASRSATDVSVRQQNSSIRVDDMANTTQEASTAMARKEALAARWLLDAQADIAPVLGAPRAQLWQQLVQTADVGTVVRELEYRIESGSMAKPNSEAKLSQLNELAKAILPFFQQIATGWGEVGPYNALIQDIAKAMGLDATRYIIQPPPPPPQPAPQEQGGKPGEPGPSGQPKPQQNGAPRPAQHGTPAGPQKVRQAA